MNTRRCRIRNIVWRVCAAALLCAAAGVPAQTVQKQGAVRMPVEQARGTGTSEVNPRHLRRQEKLRRMHEQAKRGASEVRSELAAPYAPLRIPR